MNIEHITLLVKNYDKAIKFYTEVLNFHIIEDTILENGRRWILITPSKESKISLLLVQVEPSNQYIGMQAGNNVFLFFSVGDINNIHQLLLTNHVDIIDGPLIEPWGIILKFKDLYGNILEVIQQS